MSYIITPNLPAMLAIRQDKINESVGLPQITSRVSNLLDLHQEQLRQATAKYAQAVYLKSVIKSRQQEFEKIKKEIKTAKNKVILLKQAEKIQSDINTCVGLLGELTEGEG